MSALYDNSDSTSDEDEVMNHNLFNDNGSIIYIGTNGYANPEDNNSTTTNDRSTSNDYRSQFRLAPKDKIELVHFLDKWDMKFFYKTCVDECVGLQQLYYINSYQINKLLSEFPLGMRIAFEQRIKLWRNTLAIEQNRIDANDEEKSALSVFDT